MNCIYDIVKDICIDCIFCNYNYNDNNYEINKRKENNKEKKKRKKIILKTRSTQTDIISEINEKEPGSF